MTVTTEAAPTQKAKAVRRRAVRAAGPANGIETAAAESTTVKLEKPAVKTKHPRRKAGPPPRRQPHRRLVAITGLAGVSTAVLVIGVVVGLLFFQQRHAQAEQLREQRFVDTAKQLAVNMYSINQNSIDDSIKQIVANSSGPLRDKWSQNSNVQLIEQFFRTMGGNSEAVVTGAALETIDEVSGNADVLVSVRVTPTDINGNAQPSVASRMRIVVHEDDSGRMTAYDLKWPDGGN